MDNCMSLPGGGYFNLNPGQITDCGELVMCLMKALTEMEEDQLEISIILDSFKTWAQSMPFDMEDTIKATIGRFQDPASTFQTVIEAAKSDQRNSQSNSSLMRIMPLAVWAADIDDLAMHRRIIVAQTELTHTNPIV